MCVVLLMRTFIINSLYHDTVCGSPPLIDELKEINSSRMRMHCAKQSCMLYWYCIAPNAPDGHSVISETFNSFTLNHSLGMSLDTSLNISATCSVDY